MNVATYLDTLVERVAETYLQTGVNILDNDLPVRLNDADAIIDVHPPPPTPPVQVNNQAPVPAPPPVPVGLVHEPPLAALQALQLDAPPLAIVPPGPAAPPPPPPPAYGALEDAPLGGPVAGAPAPGLGDQHLGTRYYAVFVGRQVGVFDNW